MRRLKVRIIAHVYAEGELRDEVFDNVELMAINPISTYTSLKKLRNKTITLNTGNIISVGDFEKRIYRRIWRKTPEELGANVDLCFITPQKKYWYENPRISFQKIIDKYLDPDKTGLISVGIYICDDAGQFDRDGKLSFYFHSHEKGKHNEPHVHVSVIGKDYEEPISVRTGEPLSKNPKMPKKYLALAKKYILENQSKFISGWKSRTDGLIEDIDYQLGLSKF